MSDADPAADPTDSKVGRLIERYDLAGLGDELVERWTAPAEERDSLRELADVFNRRLLAAALAEAEVETLEGDVENMYRLLTDDVSSGVRTEARNRLERQGVDVEALEREFVSHQAVHTYLRTYRDAAFEPAERGPDERRDVERERISRLQSRTEAVTEDAVERLAEADALSISRPSVLVDVRVFCDDCGGDYTVDELLSRGGCLCDEA
ncbi:rod-determining factor RdfA [Halovivax limisalsi]|uniref:rod-determining factor RdfA n=1 Tax=Halovivax limisalsi TaxID=1453760 RepID=UPI001FFD1C91|nr:rod-determining factor RdfA [Halovivax limisalsi]